MKIRKAVETDLPQINEIYSALHTEEEEGHAGIGHYQSNSSTGILDMPLEVYRSCGKR